MPKKKRMKGIVGIEAAIVLIAFVIVAAALAFVVLNMGMFTTQRSKEVIGRGLGEASSALEVDGSVLALVDSSRYVDTISLPVKLSPGREAVDFNVTALKLLLSTGGSYENILKGIYYLTNDSDGNWLLVHVSGLKLNNMQEGSVTIGGTQTTVTYYNLDTTETPDLSTIANALKDLPTEYQGKTVAFVVFIRSIDDVPPDTVLEFGEKAVIIVLLGSNNDKLSNYDSFTIELRPIEGAPLTIERTVPPTLTADSAVTLD